MIILSMHTFKYYRSSVRKKFWFSSKLINFPKTLISSSSQFFLAIEKVIHVYYKKAVVREYPFVEWNSVICSLNSFWIKIRDSNYLFFPKN